jgi:hypothetical protein
VTHPAVADAAAALTDAITTAEALITEPDTTPAGAIGGAAGSAPPWNTAAANALLDAHQLTRRLEASLRYAVTGHTGSPRGGSDANTAAAILAITRLAEAVSDDSAALAARLMDRATSAVDRLPAVDTADVWQHLRSCCPYCGMGMLRACMSGEHYGEVTCLRFGACFDQAGHHPRGRLGVSGVTGDGLVAWADGLVTP